MVGPPIQQKEKTSLVIKAPVNKKVVNGTKKYQYMICSDGSSRYYTDEQFKDSQTGFTSKSKDYCEENNQGYKMGLSDTGSLNNYISSEAETIRGEEAGVGAVKDGCSYTSIPYKTVYRDVSWLNKGETRISKGSNGTKSSCGWSTSPIDEEVLRGVSESGSAYVSPENTNGPDHNAYNRCLNSYNSSISQIQASEFNGVAGLEGLRRSAASEFSRCKRAAGY